jgi:TolB-like protein/Flp pilus assembly protein TadD
MSDFVRQLRDRRVFRTAAIYIAVAWGIVEGSTTLLPLLGLSDWAPRLVLAVVAAGFPVAVGLAWYLDVGPDGITADGRTGGRGIQAGQAVVLAGATVLGLSVPAFLFFNRAGLDEVSDRPPVSVRALDDRTVAVVPFRSVGGGEENAWFSEGITEEIVLALGRFDDIRVLSPAAASALLLAGVTPAEIGVTLGAGLVLTGTVRRADDQVRITAVLRETRTDVTRWEEGFDRALDVEGIFDVQRQVAEAVASELEARLVPARADYMGVPPTNNLEAFDHYLRGNYEMVRRTPASVTRAIAEFRMASEFDASFSVAQSREAYAYALFVDWEWPFPGATGAQLLDRGAALVEAALARDSLSADVWLATAYINLMRDRQDPSAALPSFERSLALNPSSAEAYHQYGQTLMILGRYSESALAYHAALALDPTRAMTLVPLSGLAARTRDWAWARRWIDSAVVVGPNVPYAWAIRANVRNLMDDPVGARADAEHALEIDPSYGLPARAGLATALFLAGDSAAATRELAAAHRDIADPARPGQTDAMFLGGTLVAMGRFEEALDLIESARPRSAWLWFYLQHPHFDPVREDPRFRAVESETDPR